MAQREKEETELQAPETLTLCVNNCGFYGNPATNSMCKTCFKASASSASASACSSSSASVTISSSPPPSVSVPEKPRADPKRSGPDPAAAAAAAGQAARKVKRCARCTKRVGLTGFRCRCGELFCGEHRYSDRHACGFDYKAAGRDAIARENPLVRASKIIKI